MLKTFIERPVLSTVISIIIVILGVLGLSNLPVEQYPDIAPPTVQVTANYTGASAETILESVIIPIEEQINGVEGMTYITSTATNNGTAEITVYFGQDTDPDIDAVNVQNRVALLERYQQDLAKQIATRLMNVRLQRWEQQESNVVSSANFYSSNVGRETTQAVYSLQQIGRAHV